MNKEITQGIGVFGRYLILWVAIALFGTKSPVALVILINNGDVHAFA